MNEHGLAAALTFLLPKTVKPGINGGFLIRLILEKCKTAEEAAKLLQNIPISSAHNIVVADSMGEMFVAECTAEKVFVRWCEKYAAATNHFITPAMQQYNAKMKTGTRPVTVWQRWNLCWRTNICLLRNVRN